MQTNRQIGQVRVIVHERPLAGVTAYAINMAKQTLNANISSSSGACVNVDYEFE